MIIFCPEIEILIKRELFFILIKKNFLTLTRLFKFNKSKLISLTLFQTFFLKENVHITFSLLIRCFAKR
jgi:hypothetical protein